MRNTCWSSQSGAIMLSVTSRALQVLTISSLRQESRRLSTKECSHMPSVLSIYFSPMGCTDWDLLCSNSAIALHAQLTERDYHAFPRCALPHFLHGDAQCHGITLILLIHTCDVACSWNYQQHLLTNQNEEFGYIVLHGDSRAAPVLISYSSVCFFSFFRSQWKVIAQKQKKRPLTIIPTGRIYHLALSLSLRESVNVFGHIWALFSLCVILRPALPGDSRCLRPAGCNT